MSWSEILLVFDYAVREFGGGFTDKKLAWSAGRWVAIKPSMAVQRGPVWPGWGAQQTKCASFVTGMDLWLMRSG